MYVYLADTSYRKLFQWRIKIRADNNLSFINTWLARGYVCDNRQNPRHRFTRFRNDNFLSIQHTLKEFGKMGFCFMDIENSHFCLVFSL